MRAIQVLCLARATSRLKTSRERTEYPCWLFRTVLLQGFLYLTPERFLFYAYLPYKKGAIIRSGSLSKKSRRLRRYYRHWFISYSRRVTSVC